MAKALEEETNPLAKKPSKEFKKVAKELGTSLSQIFVEFGLKNMYSHSLKKEPFVEDSREFGLKEEDTNLGKDSSNSFSKKKKCTILKIKTQFTDR